MTRAGHVGAVARAALLDMVRRRDLAVAGMFLGALLAFLSAARVVGVEDPATGTFLLNLAMDLVALVAQVATLLLAARQFPEEMENRTIHPLLARPVGRGEVVAGKWAACAVAGVALYGAMAGAVLALAPRMESYDGGTCAQAIVLQGFLLAAVAAWAMAISLALPRGLAILVAGVGVWGVGLLARWGGGEGIWRWAPDLTRLDLTLRYTDGVGPLPALDWVFLAGGAAVWILLGLTAGMWLFGRKPL